MLAADQSFSSSILIMKNDEEKLCRVCDKLVIGVNGDSADCGQFFNFIAKNLELYKIKNGYMLDTNAAVHFIRKNLADSLRNGSPYMVNILIAGFDKDQGGQLYYMDILASCMKVPFASHGFGGMLSLGILHRYYKPNLNESEAYEILKICVREIHERLLINMPHFQVTIINKDGVATLPTIKPATFLLGSSGGLPSPVHHETDTAPELSNEQIEPNRKRKKETKKR